MAQVHVWLEELKEAMATADILKRNELAVGSDGRNRCMLSPFASRTGRNQPSNTRFIFGPATWIRGLIRPGPGRALAYCDWKQQELAISAALSGDQRMMDSYTSGDPYMALAILAGAAPEGATEETHPTERAVYKRFVLGDQLRHGSGRLWPEASAIR